MSEFINLLVALPRYLFILQSDIELNIRKMLYSCY